MQPLRLIAGPRHALSQWRINNNVKERWGARWNHQPLTAAGGELPIEPRRPERPVAIRRRRDAEVGCPSDEQPRTRDHGGGNPAADLARTIDDAGGQEKEGNLGHVPVARPQCHEGTRTKIRYRPVNE